jgi:hypothetical protein
MRKITYQGETIVLVGTMDLDLTDYDEIKVAVYNRKGEAFLNAAMVGGGVWDSSLFRTTGDKEFEVIIHKSVSEEMGVGVYRVEVQSQLDDLGWATAMFDKSSAEEFFHNQARI